MVPQMKLLSCASIFALVLVLIVLCLSATGVLFNSNSEFLDNQPAMASASADTASADTDLKASTTHVANVHNISIINAGCAERKLGRYKSVDTGKIYHHPAIAHYAKLTRNHNSAVSLNFREYTSVLSVYKFLQPERIIFLTYTNMKGKYYEMTKSWKNVLIEVHKIPRANKIGGKHVTYIQHEADYIKLSALHKHGGLVLDFDVIVVNGTRLKEEQRLSECVLSDEGEYINAGFQSCIKNSSFIAKWLEGYDQDYRPSLWIHNASFKPAGILQSKKSKVCYNVHLDNTICLNPNAGQTKQWLGNKVQWRTKTAAHYFLKRGIPNDDERLLKANHSLAQLLRHVHEA
jgi:hypothetical protein